MTDRETLEAMLTRALVDFEINDTHIVVSAHIDDSETNPGYLGFFTEFTFDAEGNLKSVGAWE